MCMSFHNLVNGYWEKQKSFLTSGFHGKGLLNENLLMNLLVGALRVYFI